MSPSGHKQTYAAQKVMSALPPIADMCGATRDVRFVPIADIAAYSITSSARASIQGRPKRVGCRSNWNKIGKHERAYETP